MCAIEVMLNRFRETRAGMRGQEENFQTELRELTAVIKKPPPELFHVEDEADTSVKAGENPGDTSGLVFERGKEKGSWRYRKIEMPLFEGNDPDGWVLRSEKYFTVFRLSEDKKVDAAFVAKEGDPLKWYQWESWNPVTSWNDFKSRIHHQL